MYRVAHKKWTISLRYLQRAHHTRILKNFITYLQGVSEKSSPSKTFWNIFTSLKSFCMKFCKFVGNSYPHIAANFCTFIFNQMALN